jgi:hypothetical protein
MAGDSWVAFELDGNAPAVEAGRGIQVDGQVVKMDHLAASGHREVGVDLVVDADRVLAPVEAHGVENDGIDPVERSGRVESAGKKLADGILLHELPAVEEVLWRHRGLPVHTPEMVQASICARGTQ